MRRNRKNDITQGWGVPQSLISPSKGNEKKKLLQHVVFVVGHSSSCERRRTGVNFVERTRRDLSLWYSDSQLKNGSSVNSDHFDATDSRL